MAKLNIGKLSHDRLAGLLQRLPSGSVRQVPLGPMVGEDAAAIRVAPGKTLIVANDPVTFAAQRIGWYAVVINANDVAACGGRPMWFTACVLLPQTGGNVEAIFEDIGQACRELNVAVVGGHTEVTAGLDRPIVVGQMMGTTIGDHPIASGGARIGDVIVMTKAAGIEATAVIALERSARLAKSLGAGPVARGRRFLSDPGISIVAEAMLASRIGVSAMHDPTEGGVLCGLWEMAEASGKRFVVDLEAIPVLDLTRRLCEAVGIDPLRSLGSGSLLVTADRDRADRFVSRLRRKRIDAAIVGRVTRGRAGLVDSNGKQIAVSAVDQIAML